MDQNIHVKSKRPSGKLSKEHEKTIRTNRNLIFRLKLQTTKVRKNK
jgi:hypothetical protein